jgi:carbamoylphosphate synthase large subunit
VNSLLSNTSERKKIAFLGAGVSQFKAIECAREEGLEIITIDNRPDNPGHKLADRSYIENTTDDEKIIQLCRAEGIDGIVGFAAQAATLTKARVTDALQLPGPSFQVSEMMNNKHLTRSFMKKNGLQTPFYFHFTKPIPAAELPKNLMWPLVVKPVDNAGSLGVSIVASPKEWEVAQEMAFANSSLKECLAEEYIDGPQLHGDAWIQDGKIAFICLGDHILNGTVVRATIYPSILPKEIVDTAIEQVEIFIQKSGFNIGGINVEIRWSEAQKKAYIIEINPRNGGNGTSDAIQAVSGFHFSHTSVLAALGVTKPIRYTNKKTAFTANLLLQTTNQGYFQHLFTTPSQKHFILETLMYIKENDPIKIEHNGRILLGSMVLGADNYHTLQSICHRPEFLYHAEVSPFLTQNFTK